MGWDRTPSAHLWPTRTIGGGSLGYKWFTTRMTSSQRVCTHSHMQQAQKNKSSLSMEPSTWWKWHVQYNTG